MNNHPLNLALRFILELIALFIFGYWGAALHSGLLKYLGMIGLPLLAAAIWGIFRVENDPGKAPVAIPGIIRLLLELAFFSTAVFFLFQLQHPSIAVAFALVVSIHYCLSYDRVKQLLRQ
jgi:hypothetical protein